MFSATFMNFLKRAQEGEGETEFSAEGKLKEEAKRRTADGRSRMQKVNIIINPIKIQ
jgi:hypothetical protein